MIPVIGLSNEELKAKRIASMPTSCFAIFVFFGWICCLIGVSLTRTGLCLGRQCFAIISMCWVVAISGLALVVWLVFITIIEKVRSTRAEEVRAEARIAKAARAEADVDVDAARVRADADEARAEAARAEAEVEVARAQEAARSHV